METNDLTAHAVTGALVVYAIQWAKKSGAIPWLHEHTRALNRLVSAILAAIAAFGIDWTYDATHGTLLITGLTLASILTSGWEFLKQLVIQQMIYDGVVDKPTQRVG